MISTDQINHIQYRKNIFLPYIVKCHEHYPRREKWKGGGQVDDDNIWINWHVS